MAEVARYSISTDGGSYFDEDGDWVWHAAHVAALAALQQQVAQLREVERQAIELRRQLCEMDRCIDPDTDEDTTLERVKYLCNCTFPAFALAQTAPKEKK